MAERSEVQNPLETPKADTALQRLNRLVGTWKVSGGTKGKVTFEWMKGGRFLLQHVDLEGARGLEIIGYDEESESLRSHYFDSSGRILEYMYEVGDDTLVISIDMPRVKGQFRGKFGKDGNSGAGRWEWTQDGVKMGYDAALTRWVQSPTEIQRQSETLREEGSP